MQKEAAMGHPLRPGKDTARDDAFNNRGRVRAIHVSAPLKGRKYPKLKPTAYKRGPVGPKVDETEKQWVSRMREQTAEKAKPDSPLTAARDLAAGLTGKLPAVKALDPAWYTRGLKFTYRGLRLVAWHYSTAHRRYVPTNTFDLGVSIPPRGKKKRIHLLNDLNTRKYGIVILNFTHRKFAKTPAQVKLWGDIAQLTDKFPTAYEMMTRYAASQLSDRESVNTCIGKAIERIAAEAADTPKFNLKTGKRRKKVTAANLRHYHSWCVGIVKNVIHEWKRESHNDVEPEAQFDSRGRRILEYLDGTPDFPEID